MPDISETPYARLEAEGRLLSPVYKGPTVHPGRFGFRGEIALKFQKALENEKRPPEIRLDQVMTVAPFGAPTIPFLAGVAVSLEHLALLCEVLGDRIDPGGKYFFFAGNLDISKRHRISYGGTTFHVLPLDEATVYNELLELFKLDRGDLKRLDTAAKLEAVADAASKFEGSFPEISYVDAVRSMNPVKVRENRPV